MASKKKKRVAEVELNISVRYRVGGLDKDYEPDEGLDPIIHLVQAIKRTLETTVPFARVDDVDVFFALDGELVGWETMFHHMDIQPDSATMRKYDTRRM